MLRLSRQPAGGGERNAFGKAFAAAGFEITAELRKQFPDRFLSENEKQGDKPNVTFTQGSDSEAVVEINGKRYAINTKTKPSTSLRPPRSGKSGGGGSAGSAEGRPPERLSSG